MRDLVPDVRMFPLRAFSFVRLKNCNLIENNIKKELELPKLNLKQINFNQDNKNYNFSSNVGRKLLSGNKFNIKKNETMKKQKTKIKNKIKLLKKQIKKNEEIIKKFKEYYDIINKKYDGLIYQPGIEYYVLSMQDIFNDENEK